MDYGVIVAVASAALGAAATYGALATRLARAEQDVKAAMSDVKALTEKLERSSGGQGARLGEVEATVARTEGQCQVMMKILGEEIIPRQRRPTRAPTTG